MILFLSQDEIRQIVESLELSGKVHFENTPMSEKYVNPYKSLKDKLKKYLRIVDAQ